MSHVSLADVEFFAHNLIRFSTVISFVSMHHGEQENTYSHPQAAPVFQSLTPLSDILTFIMVGPSYES